MKNRKLITIIFISFGLLLFLYRWFYWDIVDMITPFLIFFPTIIFGAATILFLTFSFFYAAYNVKHIKKKAFIPMLIIVVCILFPCTSIRLDLDFKLHHVTRSKIVERIKAGELKREEWNNSLVSLPREYAGLSKGGGEVMIETFKNHDVFVFYTFRGVLDHYSGFVYDSGENAQDELSEEYFEIIKLADSWYYCASK